MPFAPRTEAALAPQHGEDSGMVPTLQYLYGTTKREVQPPSGAPPPPSRSGQDRHPAVAINLLLSGRNWRRGRAFGEKPDRSQRALGERGRGTYDCIRDGRPFARQSRIPRRQGGTGVRAQGGL